MESTCWIKHFNTSYSQAHLNWYLLNVLKVQTSCAPIYIPVLTFKPRFRSDAQLASASDLNWGIANE